MATWPMHLEERKVQRGQDLRRITAEGWKKVPEWIENPVAVFNSDTVSGRLLFISPALKR